jgi:hypothetical protein
MGFFTDLLFGGLQGISKYAVHPEAGANARPAEQRAPGYSNGGLINLGIVPEPRPIAKGFPQMGITIRKRDE